MSANVPAGAGSPGEPVDPRAGKLPPASMLVNVPRLITAYYSLRPDPAVPAQRVVFGTSGHRGSAFDVAFNEAHIVAITRAISVYRREHDIDGPLFLGIDTHALSEPAAATALEVLAADGVTVMIDDKDRYTPTPVISHAILTYNRGRTRGLADGIVVTPSHNPPEDGGFKYNSPNGGPADTKITGWIEAKANELLADALTTVKRIPLERARRAGTTHAHDYMGPYVADLAQVVDLDAIRGSTVALGVDPMGGAGVDYWGMIADRYRLKLTVVSTEVDATFRFMPVDRDGRIRMDPSSPCAMQRLIAMKDRFDVAWACDTDHDRHGIVAPGVGLLNPNRFLAVAADYLFRHRPAWPERAGVGKTIVTTSTLDRVAKKLGRALVEVPVGFKWFTSGLLDGTLAFVGEESAGATVLRRDGGVWTTDKDGIIMGLIAAEMTAVEGRDPGALSADLAREVGEAFDARIDAPATAAQRGALRALTKSAITERTLAGDAITSVLTNAPGNDEPIGGVKVTTARGWFAARPSGTEDILRLYAESFVGAEHLRRVETDALAIVKRISRTG